MARVHDGLVIVGDRRIPVAEAREEAGRILDACDLIEHGPRAPRQPEPCGDCDGRICECEIGRSRQ